VFDSSGTQYRISYVGGTGNDVTLRVVGSPPTISAVSDQTINSGQSTAALAFTVSDTETAAGSLVVTATSSNPSLVPNNLITLGGTGANRTVSVASLSGQSGAATITLTVTDANGLTASETFTVTVNPPPNLIPEQLIVTGPVGSNGLRFTPSDGSYTVGETRPLIPGFNGEVRSTLGDVNGDGVLDTVAVTGPGSDEVRVIDGQTGQVLTSFQAFGGYRGGLFVSVGDLNGDGKADIAVTPDAVDAFNGPVPDQLPVRVYSGNGFSLMAAFDGLASLSGASGQNNPLVKLGGRPAIADMNGDGTPDLAIGAGNGGGPRITVWDGKGFANANGGKPTRNPIANLFVFESTQRGGAFIAAGDINGDGKAEIVAGGGPGGGPRVRIVNPAVLLTLFNLEGVDLDDPVNLSNGLVTNNFFAGSDSSRGGVRVAVRDVDRDGRGDVVTGSGTGEHSIVRVYMDQALLASSAPQPTQEFDPFGGVIPGGIWVG
jgi:hypothetical protein